MPEPVESDFPEPRPDHAQQVGMYRFAYEQAMRGLDDQASEVDGMRSRAVSFMAFIGAATAFLVGTAVKTSSTVPTTWFFGAVVVATGFTAWAIYQLVMLLRPKELLVLTLDSEDILRRWIDGLNPSTSEAKLLRDMTVYIGEYVNENETVLTGMRSRYFQVIAFAAAGLLAWTAIVWTFGKVGIGG